MWTNKNNQSVQYAIEDIVLGQSVDLVDGQHVDDEDNFIDVIDGKVVTVGLYGCEIQKVVL